MDMISKQSRSLPYTTLFSITGTYIALGKDELLEFDREFALYIDDSLGGSKCIFLSIWNGIPYLDGDKYFTYDEKINYLDWVLTYWDKLISCPNCPRTIYAWICNSHSYPKFQKRILKILGFEFYGQNIGTTYFVYKK